MKKLIIFLGIFLTTNNIIAQLSDKERGDAIREITDRIKRPTIPDYSISVTDFGAKGDSVTDNKRAFDRAMKHIAKKNGGTIRVPKGVYTINGPIHFVNNVNLNVEEGAKIRFGSNPKDYPLVLTSWEGTMLYNYSPFIYGIDLKNIAITGKGTIDGESKNSWAKWRELQKEDQLLSREMNHNNVPIKERIFGEGHYLRPHLIQFVNSEDILIEGITIEDAPFWCLHLLQCKSASLVDLKYDAHNFNNDAIDLEYSSDVLIERVKFDNGDDNIAIKAGRDHEGRSKSDQPSQNIVIRDCLFKGLHAVVIGSEMSAGVKNVFVENGKAWGKLKRGIYFKTNADRGGYIKDIYINDIQLNEVEDLLYMTANYHGEGEGFNSKISDVFIDNISADEVTGTAIVIEGYEDSKVEDVKISNINVKKAKNGITITQTKNVIFEEVVIGEKAGVPTAATPEEVSDL